MAIRRLALLLPLLSACAAAELRIGLEDGILAAHNAVRAEAGVPPLRWDAGLATEAGEWARRLAGTGRLTHSGTATGENLWIGTAGAFSVEGIIGSWTAERAAFRRAQRWDDDFPHVGHYTQMVWRGTTAVGCAVARGGGNDVLVCRYQPPGNRVGERPF
jgi:uncharacterized protein YkwD